MTLLVRKLSACAALLATAFPLAGHAAPLEDYFAARDKAVSALIAAIKAGKGDDEATSKREEAAVKDLGRRMTALVGPIRTKGLSNPAFTLVSLVYGEDEPTRQLDGVAVSDKDDTTRVVVSPEPVFQAWLAARAKDSDAPAAFRQGMPAAAQTDYFFIHSVAEEAGITPYVALPLTSATGETVSAALALYSDDSPANHPPGSIVVVRIGDGKAAIGITESNLDIKPTPACDAVWKPFAAKIEALEVAAAKDNKDDDPRWEEIAKLEEDGGTAFRSCFAKEAPAQPFFAAATKLAEALLQNIRGR